MPIGGFILWKLKNKTQSQKSRTRNRGDEFDGPVDIKMHINEDH